MTAKVGDDPDRFNIAGCRLVFPVYVGVWAFGGRDADNVSLTFRYRPCRGPHLIYPVIQRLLLDVLDRGEKGIGRGSLGLAYGVMKDLRIPALGALTYSTGVLGPAWVICHFFPPRSTMFRRATVRQTAGSLRLTVPPWAGVQNTRRKGSYGNMLDGVPAYRVSVASPAIRSPVDTGHRGYGQSRAWSDRLGQIVKTRKMGQPISVRHES